jgi:hypothetical protein
MQWNPGLTRLRDLLAYLYPTVNLSRQVVEQAGMSSGQIEFTSAATSNWHNILKEALRRKKVGAIVTVAQAEFPERAEELGQAEQEHHRALEQPEPPVKVPDTQPPAAPIPVAVVRELLLAAFTTDTLRRLFFYTSQPELRPIGNEFSSGDGLEAMVEKALIYCEDHALMSELLSEVKRANPRQYARFEPQLQATSSAAPPTAAIQRSGHREMLEQELAQHQRNLDRLRAKKAVYGAGEEPLSLLNQIDHEQAEIQRIQEELA